MRDWPRASSLATTPGRAFTMKPRLLAAASSLQPTALVNEVYLRLVSADGVAWRDRAHFFAIAAHLMRLIAADSARFRGRAKRGAGWQRSAGRDPA